MTKTRNTLGVVVVDRLISKGAIANNDTPHAIAYQPVYKSKEDALADGFEDTNYIYINKRGAAWIKKMSV